jgi:FkbM family methyltransferase
MSLLRKLFPGAASPKSAQHAPAPSHGLQAQTAAPYGTALDDPESAFAHAQTLFRLGRFREAREASLRLEAAGLREARVYLQLGWSCYHLGEIGDAEAWMRKAVVVEPRSWKTHSHLGFVLRSRKRGIAEAAACFEQALQISPDEFDCLIGLGMCRIDLGMFNDAETRFRRAIAMRGERAAAWEHLGVALRFQDRDPEALEAFERAASLEAADGGDDDAFINLAINHRDAGRLPIALAMFEHHLPTKPAVHGHLAYAFALLTAGRLREGWIQFEFRWLKEPLLPLRPKFPRPTWSGQNLRGKSILLTAEQGFGDSIQFLRYVPMVKALGAHVILRMPEELTDLVRGLPGVDLQIGAKDPIPEFDYYIHLVSLPRVFGTELSSIPADIPYLHADPLRVEQWSSKIEADAVKKVGLVWVGNPAHERDRYRSMSLRAMAPLGQAEGVRFFSLQKGLAAEEAKSAPPGLDLVNLSPEFKDFSDTAAVIANLDLVICVDTSVAHLAGALGKPVWILLPWPSDWRWLAGREDSPWYPTMRLFRQNRRGDWGEVIARVKDGLDTMCREATPEVLPSATESPDTTVPLAALAKTDPMAQLCSRPGLSAVAETRAGILQYFPDADLAGTSIGWYGEFLQPQLDLMQRMLKPGATIIEVGAGAGIHSLSMAGAVGAAGHLILYEARPPMLQALRQNIAANHVGNCTVMRRPLGRVDARASLPNDHAQPADAVEADGATTVAPTVESVDALQLRGLDWLKVNHGVSAKDVLDGATDTLWRLRPWLFIGAPDESTLTSLAHHIEGFSYRCWRIETPLFNPANFNCRDDDIFSGQALLTLLGFPEEVEVDIALDGCVALS